MKKFFWVFAIVGIVDTAYAQSPSTVKEYKKVFRTYPFSDPDPIPSQGAIYPYFRFDGFTNTPVQKEWKVVELENEYIKVMILPEVGGKIWTAIEKSTGQPYIYYNQVVKFRDVAMRGPWTSGGLEPNYGIIGHTPNCATPVDYTVKQNADSSVSCFISVLDLLTRTRWEMEINLPHNKAYFTTGSYWHNPTGTEQPYYHWMNTGIKVKGNLEFIYPGTHYIGHGGEFADWPVNKENGKPINFYDQNDFGTYKSYHVFGKYADFFGAYWHNDQFGMVRYAPQDEKAGRKIWIWGLSRQGMIWEKILTDTDGQYAEIQSGRLYNQNAEQSSFTPFKHRSFAPQGTDQWKEYWYPVKQTRGMQMANAYAAVNLIRENGWIKWYVEPVQFFKDEIIIAANGKEISRKSINGKPLQLIRDSVQSTGNDGVISIRMPRIQLEWTSDPAFQVVDRPKELPAAFDWNSAYGLYVQAKELMDQKFFAAAEEKLLASLQKDSLNLPALVKLAELQLRNGQNEAAFQSARKALMLDTHDGSANYYYALAAFRKNDLTNARDGFSIAALDPAYRVAAYTSIAKICALEKNWEGVLHYVTKAQDFDRNNLTAYQLTVVALRHQGERSAALTTADQVMQLHPLDPVVKMEKGLLNPAEELKADAFDRAELPAEIWMELAAFYQELGLYAEAQSCLLMLSNHPLANYWLAWLSQKSGQEYMGFIKQADLLPATGIFPFRNEMREVLNWATTQSGSWKSRYYLALYLNDKNEKTAARATLQQLGDQPDFAPFYALRALWNNLQPALVQKDLMKAMSLDAGAWRYPKLMAQQYLRENRYAEMLSVTTTYTKAHTGNFIMEMLQAKALLLNKRYAECDALLAKMDIIPFEGATDGRGLYWEAKLMQALEQLEKKKYPAALKFINEAAVWPEHLGVGKPYDADLDSRLENWLRYTCYQQMGKKKEAAAALQQILEFKPGVYNTVRNFNPANHLITVLALRESGKVQEAESWFRAEKAKYLGMTVFNWVEARMNHNAADKEEDDAGIRVLERLLGPR